MAEYIEREAALALAESEEYLTPDGDEIYHEYIPVSAVKSIPAANVRPVVKARWNVGADGWECSNCAIESNNTYPICPYCGAMMEES